MLRSVCHHKWYCHRGINLAAPGSDVSPSLTRRGSTEKRNRALIRWLLLLAHGAALSWTLRGSRVAPRPHGKVNGLRLVCTGGRASCMATMGLCRRNADEAHVHTAHAPCEAEITRCGNATRQSCMPWIMHAAARIRTTMHFGCGQTGGEYSALGAQPAGPVPQLPQSYGRVLESPVAKGILCRISVAASESGYETHWPHRAGGPHTWRTQHTECSRVLGAFTEHPCFILRKCTAVVLGFI